MQDREKERAQLGKERILIYVRKFLYDWEAGGHKRPSRSQEICGALGLTKDQVTAAASELLRRSEIICCQPLQEDEVAYRISSEGKAAEKKRQKS